MLFKRIIEGKSMFNAETTKNKSPLSPEKCYRRRSECDGCGEHSNILEEMIKVVLLGVVLWAGVTFGSHVAPYPLNLILNSDNLHPPPMYDFPFPSAEILRRLPPVTGTQTNKSISISKFSVSLLERLELNLNAAGITPRAGSPGKAFMIQGLPSDDAMLYEKSSMIITKASQNLVVTRCARYGLDKDECASFVSTLNLRDSEYGPECAALERLTCRSNKLSSRYRSFDGSCNNPVRSSWGQALTGYKRLLHPRYADGIEQPRTSMSNKPLPSARLVSTKLTSNLDRPDDKKTIALPIWSQFIYQDLVHTPVRKTIHTNEPIRCCDNDGSALSPRYLHPSCMPISVPFDDPFYKNQSQTCMEYTRSVTTYRGDCSFGAAEQMNQATHFMDGSQLYGTNGREAAALREKEGGLLKTSGADLLPLSTDPTAQCLVAGSGDTCFKAGDIRANMHPWLASMYALWVREHNRVARALAARNPGWGSDRLFHEARRVVVAEMQHVTYAHWLPALTGVAFNELYDRSDASYNSDVNPTVSNAFATAGFHFVHSQLDQDVRLVAATDDVISLRLRETFFKPAIVPGNLEKILRGMTEQKSQGMDLNYDDDVRHGWLGGLDALALDAQRGRDHGLPGYAAYRTLCGLPQATAFHDFTDVMPQEVVEKLAQVYAHPADVDLVAGAMAEAALPGSSFGPTFTCLIKEQLWRTRAGDRYFYSHADEAGSFTKRQLAELKRASLARLLCDNGGLTAVQRDVFQPPSHSNPKVPCDEIKKVTLDLWQEPAQQPDLLSRTTRWIKTKVATTNQTK